MARVLLTGATGYIGGDVLFCLHSLASPGFKVVCLVRDESKAQKLKLDYPEIDTVLGDLNDVDLIEREAKNADVVLNLAATGHAASALAISKGLRERAASQRPAHWIQIGGASLFAAKEIAEGRYGEENQEIFDDLKDRDIIQERIQENPKRVVENEMLSTPSGVRTALVIGPLFYGKGRGLYNQRSIQATEIARCTIKLGHGFQLGAGLNSWSNLHVHDLSTLLVTLTQRAVERRDEGWNEDGFYCPENGKMTFGELHKLIAKEAHKQGLISSSDIEETIDANKANDLSDHASALWGSNTVISSSRARAHLNWVPQAPDLASEISSTVSTEASSR